MPTTTTTPPTMTIPFEGYALAVTDVGPDRPDPDGIARPLVLLVHVGMWSFVWGPVIQRLRRDHRVVTFDAPGNGHTAGDPEVDLALAARAVDHVVLALDLDDFVLAFHDLGGPASLDAAFGWPERVRAVAAINTFGWEPAGAAFRGMLALMGSAPMRGLDVATNFLPAMSSSTAGVGRHLDKDGRRAFRDGMHRDGRRAFHHYLRATRTHDFGRVDRAVSALSDRPLLTVFGEKNDPMGFQPQWQERFADHTSVVIEGGNHFPMMDDPDRTAEALRTLATRVARAA